MTDEELHEETGARIAADGCLRDALWWKAAIGLLLSLAVIVAAVWIRLESRVAERLGGPLAPYSTSHEAGSLGASPSQSGPGTVTLRLPVDL